MPNRAFMMYISQRICPQGTHEHNGMDRASFVAAEGCGTASTGSIISKGEIFLNIRFLLADSTCVHRPTRLVLPAWKALLTHAAQPKPLNTQVTMKRCITLLQVKYGARNTLLQ